MENSGRHGLLHLLEKLRLVRVAIILNDMLKSTLALKVVSAGSLQISSNWRDRLLHFERLFNSVRNIQGDVVECGVGGGESLLMIAILVRNSGIRRHIWGFDSFEGLPPATEEDLSSSKSWVKNRWARTVRIVGEEEVLSRLRQSGLDKQTITQQISLVKGWFSQTLPGYRGTQIALLHIDTDLYDSYKIALECLWPRVVVGGIAVFGGYQTTENWPGAKRAIDEFASQHSDSMKLCEDPYTDRYYAIKLM